MLITVLCESKKSLVPQAILQLVQSYYGDSSAQIEVFYNSKEVKIFDETVKLLRREKQLKITPIDAEKDPEYFNDAIFLFDTMENFQEIWENYDAELKRTYRFQNHLFYIEDASKENIQKIITRDTFQSFLILKKDQISLHAMTMFTEKKCREEQLVEINQFSNLERKWKTEKFLRPIIDNFHGCELWLDSASSVGYPPGLPFLAVQTSTRSVVSAEGALMDMLDTLSTYLNFTYIHGEAVLEKIESLGLKEEDFERLFDFAISAEPTEIQKYSFDTLSSYPICTSSDILVGPPGEFYTSWEKLFLPFDQPTWMWLVISFAAAFLVILLIKLKRSNSMYEFVIGTNVTTPSLNVIAIFMGIGQIMLPERNVSRFMFMNFVLFSLIMRTAYQGKYFEFLTSDMRKKPVETIEELKDKNFTLIMSQHTRDHDFVCYLDMEG